MVRTGNEEETGKGKKSVQRKNEHVFADLNCNESESDDKATMWYVRYVCCPECDQWYDLKCTSLVSEENVPGIFVCD